MPRRAAKKSNAPAGLGKMRCLWHNHSLPRFGLYRFSLWLAYRLLLASWFVFRPRRRGVFVAIWREGRILVIRNSYRSWLALPAGGIKRGESPAQAAQRELREEVGIEISSEALRFVREIGTEFEFKRDRCLFFETELAHDPVVRVDGREVEWASFLAPEEALAGRLAPPVREYLDERCAVFRRPARNTGTGR
jgi:8-oxo-dGTP pyrophosphatase MutT (NUDIX family)